MPKIWGPSRLVDKANHPLSTKLGKQRSNYLVCCVGDGSLHPQLGPSQCEPSQLFEACIRAGKVDGRQHWEMARPNIWGPSRLVVQACCHAVLMGAQPIFGFLSAAYLFGSLWGHIDSWWTVRLNIWGPSRPVVQANTCLDGSTLPFGYSVGYTFWLGHTSLGFLTA